MIAERADEEVELLEFLYACPVGLIELSADGAIKLINPHAMQLLSPLAPRGMIDNLYTVLCDYLPELRHIVSAFEKPSGVVCDGRRVFIDCPSSQRGVADPFVLACTLVKIDDDRLIATLSDISQQMIQERRLKQAETWFATLLDSVNDYAVISLDRDGFIDGVNVTAAKQMGISQTEMLNCRLDALDTPENGSANYTADEQIAIAQRDGWHLDEGWRKRPNGERYWCQRLIAARSEDETAHPRVITGYTVVLRDVTRSGADSAKLKKLLTTDYLTGAYNRGHFFEVCERQHLRCRLNGQPVSVIAIDIDHFKRINDRYGHATGDRALQAVASSCKALLRTTDTFARIGGEEFVVLLPATDLAAAARMAERLRVAISEIALQVRGETVEITASFGCSVMAQPSTTLAELLAEADALLYAAKRSGRNRVEWRQAEAPVLVAAE